MTTRILVLACIALAACARQDKPSTDSPAALPPIDTMKPATDSLAMRDTTGAKVTPTPAGTRSQAPGTRTASGTKRDSIIGRDSVTPFDPTKKSLPPAKRP